MIKIDKQRQNSQPISRSMG